MQAQRLRRRLLELPYSHRCCSSQRWAAAYPFPRYAENAAPPQKPPFNIAPPPQQHPAFGMPHQLPPWPPLAPPPPPPAGAPPPPPPSPQRFMEVKAAVQVQSNEASEAFASLIDSLHKKGLVQEVDRVVQAMNAAQVLLSLPSYRTLIDMYAEQGELDRMDTVYFEMRKATMRLSGHHHEAQGVPPSPMQRQQASELLAGVMDQCHKRGMHEQVQHVHRAMKAAHLAIPIPLYNILMDTYSQLGDCERMDAAYMEMRHSLAHKRSHLFTSPPPPPPPPLHPWGPSSSEAKLPPPPPPPPPPAFHSPPRPPPGFGASHFQPGPPFQPHLNVPPPHHFQPPPPPPPPGFHYPPPPPPPPPSARFPPVPVEGEAERGGDDEDDNEESVVEAEAESESPEGEAESEGSVERDDGVAESEEAEENEEATNGERKESTG